MLFDIEVLNDLRVADEHWFEIHNYFKNRTICAQMNSILVFGWKEYGKHEKVKSLCAWDYPAWKKDVNNDYHLLQDISNVLSDADVIITHNGKGFDQPFIQTRLQKWKLPLLNYKTPHGDTKRISSSKFMLINNKLDNVAKFFLGEEKLKHEGRKMWIGCRNREQWAMDKMDRYCKKDVLLLESVARIYRPLMREIPNHNHWTPPGHREVCPRCGSTRLQKRGTVPRATFRSQRYQCQDCGKWSDTLKNGGLV